MSFCYACISVLLPDVRFFLPSLGTFGDLRLTYSVQPVNIATLATADGTPVLDFFSTPIPDVVPSSSLIVSEPSVPPGSSDVTTICASECLADQACLSFATDDATYCRLYLAILTPGNSVSLPGANYYAKDLELVSIGIWNQESISYHYVLLMERHTDMTYYH